MSDSTVTIEQGDIMVERIFDAPRELVWQAWTDPKHFMQWWGPQGFTSPLAEMDLRVGGTYHIGMTSPDGQQTMYNMGTYTKITPPERLVFTQSMADADGNLVSPASMGMTDMPDETEVIVTLEDVDGKTKLTLRQIGFPESQMTDMAGGGWAQAFEKLAATLG